MNMRSNETAQIKHESLTLQDERPVFQERFDSLEAVFVPNCRELEDATSLRLVLKNKQESSFFTNHSISKSHSQDELNAKY